MGNKGLFQQPRPAPCVTNSQFPSVAERKRRFNVLHDSEDELAAGPSSISHLSRQLRLSFELDYRTRVQESLLPWMDLVEKIYKHPKVAMLVQSSQEYGYKLLVDVASGSGGLVGLYQRALALNWKLAQTEISQLAIEHLKFKLYYKLGLSLAAIREMVKIVPTYELGNRIESLSVDMLINSRAGIHEPPGEWEIGISERIECLKPFGVMVWAEPWMEINEQYQRHEQDGVYQKNKYTFIRSLTELEKRLSSRNLYLLSKSAPFHYYGGHEMYAVAIFGSPNYYPTL